MGFNVLYGFYILQITGSILYFSYWRIKGKKIETGMALSWRCVVIKKFSLTNIKYLK